MVNNKNLFRESVVFGNFVNCDDIKTGGNQANAKFKRNVLIGGDLTLGLETSTTTNGVTAYTDTGGNIIVKKNGITYTLTPTILSHLSTISSNIQDQIDDITTPDLSSYAPKNNPEFTGTPLAPTPATADDSTKIATTAFVKAQGYVLSSSFSLGNYAPLISPSLSGTPLAPTPATADDSTKIATTAFVKAQGYVLSSSFSLATYAPKDNPIFTTKITTPYISLSNPFYFELQGDYNGRKNPSYTINSYEATYDFVGDNIGYSSIINAFTTTRGSFIREHYWDDNSFTFPQSGKYLINITFYIKSNTAGNKFMLKQFDSTYNLIFSQYCLVEGNINSDTIRTYSTILNATSGGYFNLPMTNKVGTTTLYFYKTEYTNMKIMLLG
jgi:hypothetical protein